MGEASGVGMGRQQSPQGLWPSGHGSRGGNEHALFNVSVRAVAAEHSQHMLITHVVQRLVSGLPSHPPKDPHPSSVDARYSWMMFNQPGLSTKIQLGKEEGTGKSHPKAPIEAGIGKDAVR